MPSTALQVLLSQPLNTTVMVVNTAIWFWMWNKRYGYEDVSTSYNKVVVERQYYRVVSATFCHLNLLHLVFNMGSLYTVGVLEASLGSFFYFHRTVLLILLSEAVWMAITHLLVHTWRQPRFASSSAVGYSGVIFGWMTILQLYNPSFAIPLPLGLNLPIAVAPFVSLFITQLIVPQASFLGHLAGIIAGYPIALGWLDSFSGYWFYSSLLYVAAIMLVSLKANANVRLLRFLTVSPEFMRRTGMGAPTAELEGASAPAARRYMSGGILHVDRPIDAAAAAAELEDYDLERGAGRTSAARAAAAATAATSGSRGAQPVAGAGAASTPQATVAVRSQRPAPGVARSANAAGPVVLDAADDDEVGAVAAARGGAAALAGASAPTTGASAVPSAAYGDAVLQPVYTGLPVTAQGASGSAAADDLLGGPSSAGVGMAALASPTLPGGAAAASGAVAGTPTAGMLAAAAASRRLLRPPAGGGARSASGGGGTPRPPAQ